MTVLLLSHWPSGWSPAR